MNVATAAAVAVVAVVALLVLGALSAKGRFGGLSVKTPIGSVEWQAAVVDKLDEVLESVNGVPAGEPKLRETVEHTAAVVKWLCAAVHVLGDRLLVELPKAPEGIHIPG